MCTVLLLPLSPATTTLAIMQSQNHFPEPNRHTLDFLHPILLCRITYRAPLEMLESVSSSLSKVWPGWTGSHLWISSKVFIFSEVGCILRRRVHMRLELRARQLMVMPWLRGLTNATNFLTDEIIHKITREIIFKTKKQKIEPFGKNRRYLAKIPMRLTTKSQAESSTGLKDKIPQWKRWKILS